MVLMIIFHNNIKNPKTLKYAQDTHRWKNDFYRSLMYDTIWA